MNLFLLMRGRNLILVSRDRKRKKKRKASLISPSERAILSIFPVILMQSSRNRLFYLCSKTMKNQSMKETCLNSKKFQLKNINQRSVEVRKNFSHQIVKIAPLKSRILLISTEIQLFILKLTSFSTKSFEKDRNFSSGKKTTLKFQQQKTDQ